MPLPTSDFRNPVCLELRNLKAEKDLMDTMDAIEREMAAAVAANHSRNAELNSLDSSDTFASCRTHPSQGDLASPDSNDMLDGSNLYVNPLDKSSAENSPSDQPPAIPARPVKKSASGEAGIRSLGTSPLEEVFKGFGALERGSRVSLNDSPLPKNRKTRFQPPNRPRTRFGDAFQRNSEESLEGKRKKQNFMPTRSLASATKIINQHLFGLQNFGASKSGKNGSKSSLSVDSIDSRQSPQLERHRRSKSILKKSESSGARNGADPESERLISDTTSLFDAGSGGEYSPNRKVPSPPLQRRSVKNLPSYRHELERTRNLKSQLVPKSQFILLDNITNNKSPQTKGDAVIMDSNRLTESGQVPLYICPPPPPLEDSSPTEETSLLLHSTVNVMQPGNSVCKRPRQTS